MNATLVGCRMSVSDSPVDDVLAPAQRLVHGVPRPPHHSLQLRPVGVVHLQHHQLYIHLASSKIYKYHYRYSTRYTKVRLDITR